MTLAKLTFVVGGASSGKSAFAERFIAAQGGARTYIATAQAFDDEMRDKITAHRAQRGEGWTTKEAPINVAGTLSHCDNGQIVLIDCATLWLTNILLAGHDVPEMIEELITTLGTCQARVVIVSNEVGMGIVPDNALSRRFRNEQGRLNQRIAAAADTVVTVIAGLPLVLKGNSGILDTGV